MTGFRYFGMDVDSIIDIYYGVDDYFKNHPDEEKDYRFHQQNNFKNYDIFTGKKTEAFDKFLKALDIEVDTIELQIEYLYNPSNYGNLHKYTNGKYTLYIDMCEDPSLQIECCRIAVEYPKQDEKQIIDIMSALHKSAKYPTVDMYPCLKKEFMKEHKQTKKQHNIKQSRAFIKKPKKIFLAVFLMFLAAVIFFASAFIYSEEYKKTEVYREQSPNGEFEFVLYQVGSPGWPFGPVKAQVKLLNAKGEMVDKTENFWVDTDGSALREYYIKDVLWQDKELKVVFSGEDGLQNQILNANAKTTDDPPPPQGLFYDNLDNDFVKTVALNLNVPNKPNIIYTVGDKFYWKVGQRDCVQCDFYENDELVAGAIVDANTGELVRNIWLYTEKTK